jgi:hypothetical protein
VYEDVKEVIHRGIVRGRRSLEDVQHVECKIFIEGVITTVKGIYFSCDGGYHRWSCMINPFLYDPDVARRDHWNTS